MDVCISLYYILKYEFPPVIVNNRAKFSGKAGFILAAAGSAVGLGNIWRFPTLAAQNGGGNFLIIYLIILVLFGMILLCTELAIGRMSRKSPTDAFSFLTPRGKWIGVLATIVPAIILPYYCVIGGWILGYIGFYATGVDTTTSSFFGDMAASNLAIVLFVVFFLLTMFVIWRGVSKGIEKLSKIFMPIFLLMLLALVIYSLLQPGMIDGISYYLTFDPSKVSMDTVVAALGQVFFSMSLAMGIMITYGSYMRKEESIEGCALSIGVIDTLVAFLGGLLIVPMAFHAHLGDIPSGPGLVFSTLPSIFDGMIGGSAFAFFFFILLFIAAWTSSISIAEAVVASLMDRLGIDRKKAVIYVTLPVLVVGCIISLGFGPLSFIQINGNELLTLFDYVSNNLLMPIVAFGTCIIVGHVVGCKVIEDEIASSGEFRLRRIYPFMIKWVLPIFIAVIFATGVGALF